VNVADECRYLPASPLLASGLDVPLPLALLVESALDDEELKEIFEAWPHPAAADWNVKSLHLMRALMPGFREEMGQCTPVRIDLNVGLWSAVHVSLIVETKNGCAVQIGDQCERR
jgi:hypothetical protein